MADAGLAERGPEELAFIGRTVVGHDPLDRNAVAGEPGARTLQEGDGIFLALIGQELGVGQPGRIIDRHVQMLPPDAPVPDHPGVVAGDAMAHTVDPAELLGVDMDQLARPLPLIADDSRLGIERAEPTETKPAQDDAHRRDRPAHLPGYGGPGQALPSQPLDLALRLGAQPPVSQ